MHVSMNSSYSNNVSLHSYLNRSSFPSFSLSSQFQKRILGRSLARTWDRVKVLGDNKDYGHAGCVNALHWARGGELLLSAGDDTTVQIWRLDSTNTSEDYPFVCRTVIHTGHNANIFNTAMLPYSDRIVTVAGDSQVRVFDVGQHGASAVGQDARQEYRTVHSRPHTLRCHGDRVKRIATEESPNQFLTVSEDGTVRQHDLRTPHVCQSHCPAPLLQVHHELSTLAVSSYYCVVAGDSPYGYLFDRRFTGRVLQHEWGAEGVVTCVRRFGRGNQRKGRRAYPREYVTGARMSADNGHEVLLSYSSDSVYLFSTLYDPESSSPSSSSSIVPPNPKHRRLSLESHSTSSSVSSSLLTEGTAMDIADLSADVEWEKEDEENVETPTEEEPRRFYPWVDVVKPLQRFDGARNIDTVKDVNFLGPRDEYVASGSDDGNFFVWHKSTGKLHGIYEGDSAVVNVIEGHPHLPLVAVSGIDHTVKLFAPVNCESAFSRISNAESIIEVNRERSVIRTRIRTIRRYDLVSLLASVSGESNPEDATSDCVNQ
ncbi:WD40 repeat-like protein [Lentinula aciculospora]|uniref:WD40 repeat-like protein n=1 Tax=Lentinula aciculospora TaxID=153920 RepID=A0A9W9AA94_9AGAR|nr:WD40 repeat-like protein [Lentinula aciculospora]